MTSHEEQIDPYRVLEISYQATSQEIQSAFSAKMRKAQSNESCSLTTEELIQAYGLIRNEEGRQRWRWDELTTLFVDPLPPQSTTAPSINTLTLARELAFLGPWELGDDTCLD